MTTEIHPERYQAFYQPFLHEASKRVDRDGWDAYAKFLQEAVAQGSLFNDKRTPVGVAAVYEAARRLYEQLPDPYRYSDFVADPELEKFFVYLRAAMAPLLPTRITLLESELSTQISTIWQLLCFNKSGKKVYEVSPGLGERLSHTEVRGVDASMLKLPYPSFFVNVPKAAGLEVWNQDSGWHPVEGMYVTEDPDVEGARAWRLLIVGTPKGNNEFNDALWHMAVILPAEGDLEDIVQATRHRFDSAVQKHPHLANFKDRWLEIFRWLLNTVLYATMPDMRAENVVGNKEAKQLLDRINKLPKNSEKREALKQRLRGMELQRRTILGSNIKYDKHEPREGQPLMVRTWVQGFWRHQPYGPKGSLRRLQWIQPYWRGPLGDETNPTHVLK